MGSFNGRFSDEFLNTELFFSLKEAWVLAEACSAKAKAIERIKDTEESSQWVTTINPDDDINEQELKHWLHQRGYQSEVSS